MSQDRDRRDDQFTPEGEVNLNAEQILGATVSAQATDNKEDVPVIWKIFGGAIVSIIFMLIITIFGYIINHVNNIQSSVNSINSEMVKKQDVDTRVTNIWATLRQVDSLKDRLSLVEQRNTNIDSLREKATTTETKVTTLESQLKTLQEENRTQAKEIQTLRERMAVLEAAQKKQ